MVFTGNVFQGIPEGLLKRNAGLVAIYGDRAFDMAGHLVMPLLRSCPSFRRKPESISGQEHIENIEWIPAFAGMTEEGTE